MTEILSSVTFSDWLGEVTGTVSIALHGLPRNFDGKIQYVGADHVGVRGQFEGMAVGVRDLRIPFTSIVCAEQVQSS